MNSKMIPNSQLSTTEPKKQKQKQTKQATRTGTMEITWRSHGGLSVGREWRTMGGKVQGIGNVNCRYEIDRGRLRIVWGMEKPKNLHVQPMDMS